MHSGPDGSLHSESTGGHSGMNKTRQKLMRCYYWKGMTDDIKDMFARVTAANAKKQFNFKKHRFPCTVYPYCKKYSAKLE